MLAFFAGALETDTDRQRFAALYEQYHGKMEHIALGILHSQPDAEDAVQNAFCQVIRHFAKISKIPCEELPFWLISIVKNEARMLLRKRQRTVPLEDWDGFVQSACDAAVDRAALAAALRQMPETYRAVLELKLLHGCTDRETAQKLGISETAVSTRASRARALLRRLMEEGGIYP